MQIIFLLVVYKLNLKLDNFLLVVCNVYLQLFNNYPAKSRGISSDT